MNEQRIGAFGGTFDPFHNGHLGIASAVAREFALDVLLLIPSARPPHKQAAEVSETWHRYAMTVLGTIDAPALLVSAIELQAPRKPYTYETVARLKAAYGRDAMLYFVMGSDSFEEIKGWKEPRKILAACNLIVAGRPGYEIQEMRLEGLGDMTVIDLRAGGGAPVVDRKPAGVVYLTEYVLNDTSSTGLRRRAREGLSVRGFVPDLVADYIEKYRLYKSS